MFPMYILYTSTIGSALPDQSPWKESCPSNKPTLTVPRITLWNNTLLSASRKARVVDTCFILAGHLFGYMLDTLLDSCWLLLLTLLEHFQDTSWTLVKHLLHTCYSWLSTYNLQHKRRHPTTQRYICAYVNAGTRLLRFPDCYREYSLGWLLHMSSSWYMYLFRTWLSV